MKTAAAFVIPATSNGISVALIVALFTRTRCFQNRLCISRNIPRTKTLQIDQRKFSFCNAIGHPTAPRRCRFFYRHVHELCLSCGIVADTLRDAGFDR
jgi:hypothetical protein